MRLLSAISRMLAGGLIAGLAAFKYLAFKDAIISGATTQLFGRPVSGTTAFLVTLAAGLAGVALFVMGLLTLRKRQ